MLQNSNLVKHTIIDKIETVPNFHKFVVYEPVIAKKVQPGQFMLVMACDRSERIPLTFADWDAEKGTVTFIVQEVGLSTTKMAFMNKGDKFYSIVGPLGNPVILDNYGTVVLGGGCFGTAAIYPIAKAMKALGNTVISVVEGKNADMLYFDERLREISDEVIFATYDGSLGANGYIYDIIEKFIKNKRHIDHIKVIGCNLMMSKVAEVTREQEIPTYASVTTIMVDGTGMCGACRLTYDNKTKFACVDGPEFDAHKVDWDELIRVRKTGYIPEEAFVYQSFSPECRALTKYRKQNEEDHY